MHGNVVHLHGAVLLAAIEQCNRLWYLNLQPERRRPAIVLLALRIEIDKTRLDQIGKRCAPANLIVFAVAHLPAITRGKVQPPGKWRRRTRARVKRIERTPGKPRSDERRVGKKCGSTCRY